MSKTNYSYIRYSKVGDVGYIKIPENRCIFLQIKLRRLGYETWEISMQRWNSVVLDATSSALGKHTLDSTEEVLDFLKLKQK